MDLTVLKFLPIKGSVICLVEIDDLVYVGTNRSHAMVYDRKWNVSSTLISNNGCFVNNVIKFNDNVYLFTNVIESVNGDVIETLDNKSHYNFKSSVIYDNTLFVRTIERFIISDMDYKQIKSERWGAISEYSNLLITNGKVWYVDENGFMFSYDKYGNMLKSSDRLFNEINQCPYIIEYKGYLYVSFVSYFDSDAKLYIYKDMVKLNSIRLKNPIYSMVIHNDNVICGHKGGFLSIWKEDECLMYRKVHSYDIKVMLSFNDQLWLGMDRLVLVLGEYHKHHYSGLPQMQLDKLMEWEEAARIIPIHKDINLLFIRELLQ